MRAIVRALLCVVAMAAAAPVGAICTPATINPGALQAIRPYMSPAAVSGIFGCAPTESPPLSGLGVWIWGIPFSELAGAKVQVAVVFDEAGVSSAFYQVLPVAISKPTSNGALRVEPPLPPFGNWVPGVAP